MESPCPKRILIEVRSDDLADAEDQTPNQTQLGQRRPILMAMIGSLVGGSTACVCGGVGAGLLGLIAGVTLGNPLDFITDDVHHPEPTLAIPGSIFGAFLGGGLGVLIGAIVGLSSGLVDNVQSRTPIYIAAILSALGGGAVGLLGGAIVSGHGGPNLVFWALGSLIGIVVGLFGGTFMGASLRQISQKLRRRTSTQTNLDPAPQSPGR